MEFKQQINKKGFVQFCFCSDSAEQVNLFNQTKNLKIAMHKGSSCNFRLETDFLSLSDSYSFLIDNNLTVPDPLSKCQEEDVQGPSVLYDQAKYHWKASDWNGLDWEDTIIYELHLGTFSAEGTFDGARQKLEHLKNLGITAIELMPIADFPGRRNWGYDGVLHYAPDRAYGHPDDLKQLIDEAHQKGIMVFLDVVYNHFGPEGNFLWGYAKNFLTDRYQTPWGSAINFDGDNSDVVREYFIQNAIYWLKEFRFDGLRFDAVHAIFDNSSKHILCEIKERIIQELPPNRKVHLILENDDNNSDLLKPNKNKQLNQSELTDFGLYDAQWNDDLHHCIHVLLTNETQGYYEDYTKNTIEHLGKSLAEGFVYQGQASIHRDGKPRGKSTQALNPLNFVNFIQNHDQIGNRAFGERLHQLASQELYRLAAALYLLCPSVPMLFMGEEWQSENPFLYFCDFDEELSSKVRGGRAKEFAKFPDFQNPEKINKIPDPTSEFTFLKSKLNWKELEQNSKKENLHFYKNLIELRKTKIIPLLKGSFIESGYKVINNKILHVHWSFLSSNQVNQKTHQLNFLMNLSEQPQNLKELISNFLPSHSQASTSLIYKLKEKSSANSQYPDNLSINLEINDLVCFLTEVH